jgi:hypothetical protein
MRSPGLGRLVWDAVYLVLDLLCLLEQVLVLDEGVPGRVLFDSAFPYLLLEFSWGFYIVFGFEFVGFGFSCPEFGFEVFLYSSFDQGLWRYSEGFGDSVDEFVGFGHVCHWFVYLLMIEVFIESSIHMRRVLCFSIVCVYLLFTYGNWLKQFRVLTSCTVKTPVKHWPKPLVVYSKMCLV